MIRGWRDSIKIDHILGHWIWAVPIILAVALFAIREVDKYPPSPDEFRSMANVGWVVDGPFTPSQVLESLAINSPGQAPLHYLLLNLWGRFVPQDIVLARVFTIYCGMLYLAISFRLVRYFVAPVAGLFALTFLASNAFLNFYWPYARMYELFQLTAASALWFYLRIMHGLPAARRRSYLGLFLSCLALAGTNPASICLYAAVGAYHLLTSPKGKRWLRVLLCTALALLLFSPWAIRMFTIGMPIFFGHKAHSTINTIEITTTLINFMFNGNVIMLLVPVAGLVIAWRRQRSLLKRYHLLILYFLAVILIVEQTLGTFSVIRLRYLQPGFILLALTQAAGMYALYRLRRWVILLLPLWMLTGLVYHNATNWQHYLSDRRNNLNQLPTPAISRHAILADSSANILAYRTRQLDGVRPNLPLQVEFYFDNKGIGFYKHGSLETLLRYAEQRSLDDSDLWILYQRAIVHGAEARAIDLALEDLHYSLCETVEFSGDAVLLKYRWSALNCGPTEALRATSAAQIDYRFFGARPGPSKASLAFSDRWNASADALGDQYRMSHQLISEDGRNVAQLDLPLVREGIPRQFTIDIAHVPAGRYRLAAILYDGETGDRFTWIDGDEQAPEMLTLAEIEL